MSFFARLLLILAILATALPATAAEECPEPESIGISEHYDVICVLVVENRFARVYFCRNGKVVATRWLSDDFLFLHTGDHFTLTFQEFWGPRIQRYISCDQLCQVHIEDEAESDGGEWWNAARVMTDLRTEP